MDIVMEAIGCIKSDFTKKADLPRQSVLNTNEKAIIEVLPKYAQGLKGIKEEDYIVVLFNFHKSTKAPLQFLRRTTNEVAGVFSTRSPNRPNGIGMSIVKVTGLKENIIEFEGVDMLDGTPVLDIKPYSQNLNPKEV